MTITYRGIKTTLTSILSTHLLYQRIQKVADYASGDLLDIGCGRKPYEKLFNVARYIGMDWLNTYHSLDAIDIAGDSRAIPFASSCLDTVLCTEVLEHVASPMLVMAEIERVLKPGGILILSAPFLHPLHEQPYDYFRYSVFGIKFLVENSGLELISVQARGGTIVVLLDVWIRAFSKWIKQLATRLHIPSKLIEALLLVLIGVPQYAVIAVDSIGISLRSQQDALLKPQIYTLGHVIVARKQKAANL